MGVFLGIFFHYSIMVEDAICSLLVSEQTTALTELQPSPACFNSPSNL